MNDSLDDIDDDSLEELTEEEDLTGDDELEEAPTLYEHFRFVADKGQSL